jgi:sensor histidine kinase YesM
MTPFTPLSVINWYKAKPKWLKVLLALVLIIPLVLAAIWWILGKMTTPSKADVKDLVDAFEQVHDDRREGAEQRDKEYAEEIAELEESRKDKEKDKQQIMEGNRESHENIDKIDGISNHIADYNAGRRRRKPK